jgi:hypothetical protein
VKEKARRALPRITPAAAKARRVRLAQEDDIREAVFRYQFKHDPSGLQEDAKVFFIEVGGKDPSSRFLGRFRGSKPPVKKRSRSRISRRRAGFSWIWVEDKQSGKPGIIFSVDSIKWRPRSEAMAKGGWFASGRGAADYEYSLVREKGKWVVKKDRVTAIA